MVLKSIDCLLSDGTTCKIDIGFYPEFKKNNWCINNHGYIVTYVKVNEKKKTLLLHHRVLNFKYDPNINLVGDHKYRNLRDYRLKKLRLVSRSTNNLNTSGHKNNTGFTRIHCTYDYETNHYGYQVSFINMNKEEDKKWFPYIPGENEEDVFLKAFEFYEYTLTFPHYKEAFPNKDDESSSGENIHETKYEHRINTERLYINNTSKHLHISNRSSRSSWIVSYFNENGLKRQEQFKYNPNSNKIIDKKLIKAIKFRDEYEKYRPENKKKNKRPRKKQIVYKNTNINIIINNNIVKTKKKKKPIPKDTKSNIEDDATTSPDNEDTESSNDDFRNEYNKFNRKNIPVKSKFDMLIEENTNPIENGNVSDSYEEANMIIESMVERINRQNKHCSGDDSDSETIIMDDAEIFQWEKTGHPDYYHNNPHKFILK